MITTSVPVFMVAWTLPLQPYFYYSWSPTIPRPWLWAMSAGSALTVAVYVDAFRMSSRASSESKDVLCLLCAASPSEQRDYIVPAARTEDKHWECQPGEEGGYLQLKKLNISELWKAELTWVERQLQLSHWNCFLLLATVSLYKIQILKWCISTSFISSPTFQNFINI